MKRAGSSKPDSRPDSAQGPGDMDSAYRRAQVFGLLLIAAGLLAAILARADMHVLFAPGWWRF